jgi:hypothetical protein
VHVVKGLRYRAVLKQHHAVGHADRNDLGLGRGTEGEAVGHGAAGEDRHGCRSVTRIAERTADISRVIGPIRLNIVLLFSGQQELGTGQMIRIVAGIEMRNADAAPVRSAHLCSRPRQLASSE